MKEEGVRQIARHKESMIAEGMTGISFLIKIMCIIFWAVYRLFL